MNRLRQKYQDQIVKDLVKQFSYQNNMQAPKITKVVINVGVSEPQHQKAALASVAQQLELISGQKSKITRATKSIAGFKLRAGDPIGVIVTLRSERMYEFLDKLISIVLPRVKDFQGVSTRAFDHAGNYSLGIKEQIIFPEIDYDKIDNVRSLQVNIVTTAKNKQEGLALLTLMGMPFEKEISNQQY